MKMGAEKSERLYEEITDYEKLKSIFGDVILKIFMPSKEERIDEIKLCLKFSKNFLFL
jgi:hypothetical protein